MPKLTTSSATTTLAWTTVPGTSHTLGARRGQVRVAVPQRGGRREVVRRLGDDDPHLHPAPGGRQQPLDGVAVGEVRVHHVEPLTRRVDLLRDGLGRRDEAAGDHLREGDRRRAGVGRRGEVPGQVGRQRAPVAAEARQERRLRLADDVAGDAHHHVVEPAVVEVILDAGSARPGHAPVDDVQLAMVGAPQLAQAPRRATGGEQADPVGREDVVDDDLRTRCREPREHRARLPVGPGAEPVDDHPHLETLRQLPLQQRGHPRPHLTLPPAEHEDVHR